ncbi:MAG: RidA family protein [Actinomycetota bacterium]
MTVELRNAASLPEPQGFSHASIAPSGRIVHLAGQLGSDADGVLADGLAAQTERALGNLVEALRAAGAEPEHLVKTTIYVVRWSESMQPQLFEGIIAAGSTTRLPQVPITLIGVHSLFLDDALVEIEGTAVLPD